MAFSGLANVPHPLVIQHILASVSPAMLSESRGFFCPYAEEGIGNQSNPRVAAAAQSLCQESGIVLAIEQRLSLLIIDAMVLEIAAGESTPVADFDALCTLLLSKGQLIADVLIDPASGDVTIVESAQGTYSFDPGLSSGDMVAKGRELMMERRDYVAALSCFEQAVEKDRKNADAWFNKAQALQFLGRSDEASKCFGRSLELSSSRVGDMLGGSRDDAATVEDEPPDELAQKLRDLQEVNERLDQSGVVQQAYRDMTTPDDEGKKKKKRWWRSS